MHRKIRIQPRFWLFIIAAMLLCFGASSAVAQYRYTQVSEHLHALNQEKLQLTDRISALNTQLNYVRTDAYVERVARDELNMLLPGEIRYVSN